MQWSLVGISALAFLTLLLTVPSAFADDPDPVLAFGLMLSISDGQADLENLEALIENNSFTVDWGDYTLDAFEYAAELADMGEYAAAQAVLDAAEISHDIIYDQLYEQIDEQQDVRHDEYVMKAKSSLTFLIENGQDLGLTQPTIDQLATTLAVLESGTDGEIDAATGQIGITLSVLPKDLSLPSSFTTGSGIGEQLKSKLPPGIAKKYGYSNDSDLTTTSFDSETNDNEDKLEFVDKKLEQGGLPDGFEKKVDGILSLDSDGDAGDLPDGFAKKLGDDGEITIEDLLNLPKGFLKKALGIDEIATIFYGGEWSPDDWFGGFAFDEWTLPFEDDISKDKKDKKDKKLKEDKKSKKVKTDDPDKDKDKDKKDKKAK